MLAAYDARRPTRDVDLAGVHVPGDLAEIHRMVQDVIAVKQHLTATSPETFAAILDKVVVYVDPLPSARRIG